MKLSPFILWVEQMLLTHELSQRKLAARADIPRYEVDAIMRGDTAPTYRFCVAVAEFTNTSLAVVLHKAELLTSHGSAEDNFLQEILKIFSAGGYVDSGLIVAPDNNLLKGVFYPRGIAFKDKDGRTVIKYKGKPIPLEGS